MRGWLRLYLGLESRLRLYRLGYGQRVRDLNWGCWWRTDLACDWCTSCRSVSIRIQWVSVGVKVGSTTRDEDHLGCKEQS